MLPHSHFLFSYILIICINEAMALIMSFKFHPHIFNKLRFILLKQCLLLQFRLINLQFTNLYIYLLNAIYISCRNPSYVYGTEYIFYVINLLCLWNKYIFYVINLLQCIYYMYIAENFIKHPYRSSFLA